MLLTSLRRRRNRPPPTGSNVWTFDHISRCIQVTLTLLLLLSFLSIFSIYFHALDDCS